MFICLISEVIKEVNMVSHLMSKDSSMRGIYIVLLEMRGKSRGYGLIFDIKG